ncbi:MAG: hypothetical protein JWL65_6856 [Gammaproteobacteria bacterium]|nr:hypothetical protein [Gammaproteobacteria bacterium]
MKVAVNGWPLWRGQAGLTKHQKIAVVELSRMYTRCRRAWGFWQRVQCSFVKQVFIVLPGDVMCGRLT